jgi:hypothetical protein
MKLAASIRVVTAQSLREPYPFVEMRRMLRSGLSIAVALGAFWWCPQAAVAQSASGHALPAPAAKDARIFSVARASAAPKTKAPTPEPIPPLPERKDAKGAAAVQPPEVWQPQEIAAAKARCAKLLKEIEAVAVPHPPIKEGQCGAPAPIRLVSLGKTPQVAFTPPALVTCDLAVALHDWINKDLQPLAAKHLGAKITKVEVMSDYSCRTAFGRVGNKLSEHAFADALDIRGFVTETGETARVLDAWGMTSRDIAAAKAEAERKAADQAAAGTGAQGSARHGEEKSGAAASKVASPAASSVLRTRADGIDKITVALPVRKDRSEPLGLTASRLGGPGAAKARREDGSAKYAALSPQAPAVPAPEPRWRFLRAAHAAACRIFGTTLGPEANEAHRNHFHVDMAERKYKKICD